MYLSRPLAILEVQPEGLVWRVRKPFNLFGALFGARPVCLEPGDGAVLVPLRLKGRATPGVGCRRAGRPDLEFYGGDRDEILSILADAGYRIDSTEQVVSWWS